MKQISANITGSIILNGVDVTETVGSSAAWSGSLASRVSSLEVFTGSMNAYTASNDSNIASLNTFTSSVNTTVSSLNVFTSSANSRIGTLENVTASYATTASNAFNGNQTVTGSLVVTGQVIAQTLNVQQVTSSVVYSSGSNVFGNNIANTHQFTGSVLVSGSATINGGFSIITSVSPGFDITKDASVDNRYIRLTNSQASSKNWDLVNQTNSNGNEFILFNHTDNLSAFRLTPSGSATFLSDVTAKRAILLSNSSTTEALIIGGAGGAGSTRQGQLKFGDAGTVYKIQGGEDYSAINFIIGSTTVQSLASNGAAIFSGQINGTSLSMSGGINKLGTTDEPSSVDNITAQNFISAPNSNFGNALLVRTDSSGRGLKIISANFNNSTNTGTAISLGTDNIQAFASGNASTSSLKLQPNGSDVLVAGATTDGTNKLIVNGGVKTNINFNANDGTRNFFFNPSADFGNGALPSIQVLSNHALQFATNNTLRLTLDASTGAATFSSSVTANGLTSTTTANPQINIVGTASTAVPELYFKRSTTTTVGYLGAGVNSTVSGIGDFVALENRLSTGGIILRTNGTTALTLEPNQTATFSSTVTATSTGVDGTYADGLVIRWSGNVNETNAIQTAVSSNGAQSGFRFMVSNGGGSSARTTVLTLTREQSAFTNIVTSTIGNQSTSINNTGTLFLNNVKSDLSAGQAQTMVFGKANSSNNVGAIRYVHSSDGSNSNYIGFGFWNNDDKLKIEASGAATFTSLGTGTVYSNSGTLTNTNPSDRNLKTNITPITYGLQEVLKLNPVSYNWKDDTNTNKQFGFIAQEVQEILPDAVIEGEYLGLEKDAIYASLVNAIKELTARIEQLENK